MAYETILYDVADQILTITLNRPDRLNALTEQRRVEVIDAMDRADADDNVRAIIFTGAGRGYCAGADLSRFQNVNWEGLAVQDPGQYQQAKAIYEQAQSTYNLIRGQAESHMTQMQERAQAELKQRASESLGILKSTIPNWSNDLYYEIGDYAQKELGVSSDEFNNIADHRSITAMWKAMQYDRAKTVTTEKKVKASPQKTLSGSKADANKVNSGESYRKARDNLRKTGSMDAAVQALLNRKR